MVTLETARLAFNNWRASKPNINTPAPNELWAMTMQLLQKHKQSEICKTLGISGRQIKSHCIAKQPVKNRNSAQNIDDFVEAALPKNAGMAEINIKGSSKSLHLCLPVNALGEILPILGALL